MIRTSTLFVIAAFCMFSCSAEKSVAPVDPLDTVSAFEGEWTGTHKMLGIEDAFAASYSIKRVDDTLVWDFESTFMDGFTGQAIWRWDKERGQWAETWKDSSGEPESVSYSDWDAATATMRSSTPGKDWNDPTIDLMIHGKAVVGEHGFDYTMTYSYPDGKTTEVMWIHMTPAE
jgi:hypothetical protein